MPDLIKNRDTLSFQSVITVSQTATLLAVQNPNRVGLVISCPTSGILTVSIQPTAQTTSGVQLVASGQPLVLSMQALGTLVTQPFLGTLNNGSATVTVWETLSEDYPQ